ncbi:MAG TPA: cytochrome c, partial [Planctomycetota bacterium]|nr:cytochrome c [Planctomycetota bacterium]
MGCVQRFDRVRGDRPVKAGRVAPRGALAALLLLATTTAQQPPAADAQAERGAQLFARQCAACHGDTGRGDGPVAYLLDPKPRNFTSGTFRVVSTDNAVPSEDDLLTTLRRGMPGSAMPPWGQLPDADLRALVATVRRLVVEGRADAAMA